MPCTPFQIGTMRGLACGRGAYCGCGRPASLRCDWKVAARKSGTCDAWVCESCATRPAPDKDLCPKHGAEWAMHPANPRRVMTPGG